VTNHADDLDLALRLADEADTITLARFQAIDLHVTSKPDNTPVSDADTAVESMIRARLAGERPADAVIGEEEGAVGEASRRWILDPVDGTKNYIRGGVVWATLIGLEIDGEIIAGVVSAPAMGRRWWARRGGGAWTRTPDGATRQINTSAVAALSDAFLSFASIEGWTEKGRLEPFLDLASRVWRTRAYGDFWSHMMVAEGAVDLACEPVVSLWDLAAPQIIVEEAGGRFTDHAGVATSYGGTVLSTNGHLHDEVLGILKG
jgi:histidinol-phosphatase